MRGTLVGKRVVREHEEECRDTTCTKSINQSVDQAAFKLIRLLLPF
jgi:hypothetical protein